MFSFILNFVSFLLLGSNIIVVAEGKVMEWSLPLLLHYYCYLFESNLLINCFKYEDAKDDWEMKFNKISDPMINPVLGPIEETSFRCPVRRKEVNWEAKDVFNPAAVVKDDKVYLLYRAEDRVSG